MKDELYHHGVKGQKWGIITEKPKSYSKALNRNDKQIAKDIKSYGDSKKVYDNYARKKERLNKRGKDLSVKTQVKMDTHKRSMELSLDRINKGRTHANKLISEAQNQGYDVYMKNKRRNVTTGKEYIANAAVLLAFGAMGAPVAVTRTSYVNGTQYKVK